MCFLSIVVYILLSKKNNPSLAKFGVSTTELDDGLEVHGQEFSLLKQNVSIQCYDDHRVAMSFSVLSTLISNVVIEEKRCVEKTWPNWWDDLQNKVRIATHSFLTN